MQQNISFSQNGEDILLKRVFAGEKKGFYIDIGASHPDRLSVTKIFYDAGWNGINVDPVKNSMELFGIHRPRDINLNLAIASDNEKIKFWEVSDNTELSTSSAELAKSWTTKFHKIKSYTVNTLTCNELFERYVKNTVDFLKIDVEGSEKNVIQSLDLKIHRPKVLVIESTIPDYPFPGWENLNSILNHGEWEYMILNNGYDFVHFDGLNRYYVREENKELTKFFDVGLCLWDDYITHPSYELIGGLQSDLQKLTKQLTESETDRDERLKQIQALTKQLTESETGLKHHNAP